MAQLAHSIPIGLWTTRVCKRALIVAVSARPERDHTGNMLHGFVAAAAFHEQRRQARAAACTQRALCHYARNAGTLSSGQPATCARPCKYYLSIVAKVLSRHEPRS